MEGEYSVRSAYCQLVADDTHGMPSSSSPGNSQKFWKKIWNNKVRHFLWRAVKDSLLTKQNLKEQHLPVDDTCDHYNDFPETVLHAFSYVMRLGLFGYAIILDTERLSVFLRSRGGSVQ